MTTLFLLSVALAVSGMSLAWSGHLTSVSLLLAVGFLGCVFSSPSPRIRRDLLSLDLKTVRFALGIFIFALIVRIAWFVAFPGGVAGDEVMNIVDAKRVITGEVRNPYLSGNWSNPILFHYIFAVPLLLGISEFWCLKSVAVLSGALVCSLIYVIGAETFSRRVGCFAGILAACSSWLLLNSRMGYLITFEPVISAGILLALLRSIKNPSLLNSALGGVLLGMALVMNRPVAAVILPVLVSFIVLLARRDRCWGVGLIIAIGTFIFVPRLVVILSDPSSVSRQLEVALFNPSAWMDLKAKAANSPFNTLLMTIRGFFIEAGYQLRWNIVPRKPALDIATGTLFLVGLALVSRRYKALPTAILLMTLLAGLIPCSLALMLDDSPVLYRMYVISPVLFLLAGLGLESIVEAAKRSYLSTSLVWALIIAGPFHGLWNAFVLYPRSSLYALAFPRAQMGRDIRSRCPDCKIFVSGRGDAESVILILAGRFRNNGHSEETNTSSNVLSTPHSAWAVSLQDEAKLVQHLKAQLALIPSDFPRTNFYGLSGQVEGVVVYNLK